MGPVNCDCHLKDDCLMDNLATSPVSISFLLHCYVKHCKLEMVLFNMQKEKKSSSSVLHYFGIFVAILDKWHWHTLTMTSLYE